MGQVKKCPKGWVERMRNAFFDIAGDGVLAYQDPLIGRLEYPERRISVRFHLPTAVLELRRDGIVVETFPVNTGPEEACRAAAGAYFAAVAKAAARQEPIVAAA